MAFTVVNRPIIMSKHVVFRRDTFAAPQIFSVVATSRASNPTPRSLIDRNTQVPQFRCQCAVGLSAIRGDEDSHVRVGPGTPYLGRALHSLPLAQENAHLPLLLPSGEPATCYELFRSRLGTVIPCWTTGKRETPVGESLYPRYEAGRALVSA